MTRLRILFVVTLLFCPHFLFAQRPVRDYSRSDSVATTVKYEGDINLLTKKLTTPFSDPFLKARAIFRWIANNIDYDCKFYNRYEYKGKEPKGFECEADSLECSIRYKVWETQYVLKVLDRRKAVCEGYSRLFQVMCGIAGIECEVVRGYVRTEDYEIGTPGELNHAWNVVLLNGVYYPVDATWAAGGCWKNTEGRMITFFRYFHDYYWLTPPADFARDHFPEDPKWVLVHNYTKEKFSTNPYYSPSVIDQIKLLAPATGIISAKKGDTIRFKFKLPVYTDKLQINTNIYTNPDVNYMAKVHGRMVRMTDSDALKQQRYVPFKSHYDGESDSEIYDFVYVVNDYSLDYIDVILGGERIMRFKVRVHR